MAWFFTDSEITGESHTITGEDALHIKKSLRMKEGEELTLVTPKGIEASCVIDAFLDLGVETRVKNVQECTQEPSIRTVLYQGLTKGDKMDFIIQKSVELGVSEIVPVITERCISRPDEKSVNKKIERWQKIALCAAQQSRRGIVPRVMPLMNLTAAADKAITEGAAIVFYECGGKPIRELVNSGTKRIGIFIGSEGGFEKSEIAALEAKGVISATLGKRILRAETAPLAALSAIMLTTGNLE